jgi:hypothetical protein
MAVPADTGGVGVDLFVALNRSYPRSLRSGKNDAQTGSAGWRAFHPYGPPMQAHDLVDNGQPDSAPRDSRTERSIAPAEWFENHFTFGFPNPWPLIVDRQHRRVTSPFKSHGNSLPFRTVLHGILQKVHNDLA